MASADEMADQMRPMRVLARRAPGRGGAQRSRLDLRTAQLDLRTAQLGNEALYSIPLL